MRPIVLAFALLALTATRAMTDMPESLPGWRVLETPHDYQTLIERVDQAVKDHKMAVVTRASATVGAKKALDKTIPGNMVVGVYHPRFAVRMLEASTAAGIEAPIRLYITEDDDGSATLSYKTPSTVFAPYDDGGEALDEMAAELDEIMGAIVDQAASGSD